MIGLAALVLALFALSAIMYAATGTPVFPRHCKRCNKKDRNWKVVPIREEYNEWALKHNCGDEK